jgi:hypothetical protein
MLWRRKYFFKCYSCSGSILLSRLRRTYSTDSALAPALTQENILMVLLPRLKLSSRKYIDAAPAPAPSLAQENILMLLRLQLWLRKNIC